ncbi:hypothetical protein ACFQV8_03895 [Pseudonocardia benzenivorans]
MAPSGITACRLTSAGTSSMKASAARIRAWLARSTSTIRRCRCPAALASRRARVRV